MKFVLKPKEDITALELAHILTASSIGMGHDPAWRYLSKKCPSAIRHVYNMNQHPFKDEEGNHQ